MNEKLSPPLFKVFIPVNRLGSASALGRIDPIQPAKKPVEKTLRLLHGPLNFHSQRLRLGPCLVAQVLGKPPATRRADSVYRFFLGHGSDLLRTGYSFPFRGSISLTSAVRFGRSGSMAAASWMRRSTAFRISRAL